MFHGQAGPIYLVGTSTGLYSTSILDGDKTVWTQEGEATIGNVVVDMMDVRQSDGYVVVGTHGNGAFSTAIVTGAEEPSGNAAAGLRLEQNYPNPVASATTIRFTIPSTLDNRRARRRCMMLVAARSHCLVMRASARVSMISESI